MYINGHVANPFASWITWASNTSQIPYVHSLSVGEPEGSFQSDVGSAAMRRMNDEFAARTAIAIPNSQSHHQRSLLVPHAPLFLPSKLLLAVPLSRPASPATVGARGISLVFASGDSGFVSEQKFPASSPYVTSVGGATFGAIFRAPYIEVDVRPRRFRIAWR